MKTTIKKKNFLILKHNKNCHMILKIYLIFCLQFLEQSS